MKTFFIGIDISKKTIDCAYYLSGQLIFVGKYDNDTKGFKSMIKDLKSRRLNINKAWFVMENTGDYTIQIALFLEENNYTYSIVPAMKIKETILTQRGKNDKVDAIRIAEYGQRFSDRIKPTQLADSKVFLLRKLMTERRLLTRDRASYVAADKSDPRGIKQNINRRCQERIAFLEKQIEEIDKEMAEVIAMDELLAQNYELLDGIKGIGLVNAVNIIVYTDNFTLFDNARQYAAFCNVAPFECSSGTSVRKGTHTSHKGHKQLKADLIMAARSAIVHNPDLRLYYQRKVAEGKSRKLVLNNVAFKLITFMFAVIKRQTPYVYINNYSTKKSKAA